MLSLCYPPTSTGFFSINGVITATGNGKGLGVSTLAGLAWISDPSTTFVPGTGLSLFFGSVPNQVNRGDSVNIRGYLSNSSGALVMEVCQQPTYLTPSTATIPPAGAVTTAMFTPPLWVYPGGGGVFTSGTTFPTYGPSNQPPGGLCAASTKPLYDGSLVTFTNAKIMSCANPTSNMGGAVAGKIAKYPVCQPSNSPLTDTTGTAYGMTSVCTSCIWDKYSNWWISTDNGATGIEVSSTFYRASVYYQMTVGATFSITGILQYQGPGGQFAASQWVLTPRSADDFVGLSLIAGGAYPQAIIGDSVLTGVKQQTEMWASPGPTLPSYLDPNGVTAAANLPLGVPPALLGPADAIDNGTSASGAVTTIYGAGSYLGSGSAITPYPWNGCPNATAFGWLYTYGGGTRQNLCDCFPPRYYSPQLGNNGAGTTYVQTTGVVSFIEGGSIGSTSSGSGSFYLQSGCGPNQQLYVYQDSAAGKTVTVGDSVTITAIPYSYYGLVEMQNTLQVTVLSHNNPICAPIQMSNIAAISNEAGSCAASAITYRANMVTLQYLTVTKLAMYEPYPLTFNYYGNGTAAYSAAFNSTSICKNTIGGWSLPGCTGNWFNSNAAKLYSGVPATHPTTGTTFSALIEVVDQSGHHILVDQCPYGANGGLIAAFMGTDGVSTPLKVGDTFTSITGTLKYSRGGTYQNSVTGGNLMLCVTSDTTLAAGRNVAWPTSSSSTTTNNVALGVGLGVGLGGGLILVMSALYFFVLKKRNIEVGQKSAVAMTANPAPAAWGSSA